MKINLKSCAKLEFLQEDIDFKEKISILYGKNGVGKTTISEMIVAQKIDDNEVRLYDGFDNIVNENRDLDAVILGEENVSINNEIKKISIDNEQLINEKIKLCDRIEQREGVNNEWAIREKAKKEMQKYESKINNILSKIASEIKNINNPQIANVNYNINSLKQELNKAQGISQEEKAKNIQILQNVEKNAKQLVVKEIDYNGLISKINEIITISIKEKNRIQRFSGEDVNDRINFAKEGLRIHKPGDVCSFCGSVIKEIEYSQLVNYFTENDIQIHQENINNLKESIVKEKESISNLEIDINEFYDNYVTDVSKIKINFDNIKNKIKVFFNILIEKLDEKNRNIVKPFDPIAIDIPEQISTIVIEYNKKCQENNNVDKIKKLKDEAKEKLRFNEIYNRILNEKYNEEKEKYEEAKEEFEKIDKTFNELIKSKEELCKKINENDVKINDLQKQTTSEEKIANLISDKIDSLFDFTLEHIKDSDNKGAYKIKDKYTFQYRNVFDLSTGEKNVIAFLYFVIKLDEIKSKNNKIIVFDDPMNSNDDITQYLIMKELTNLMCNRNKYSNMIILTHNSYLYLNLSYYGEKLAKSYIKRYRLEKSGQKRKINEIEYDKDIRTKYDDLWYDLKTIYNNCTDSKVLLNPMRRIIETFTVFNKIDKNDFFKKVNGQRILYNLNSHTLDPCLDIDIDLSPYSKEEAIGLFKECFVNNGFEKHFEEHWM